MNLCLYQTQTRLTNETVSTPQYHEICRDPPFRLDFSFLSFPLQHSNSTMITPNMAPTNLSVLEQAHEAVELLKSQLPKGLQKPKVAVVCGSGLSGLADTVQAGPRVEYDYASIPHFPRPTGKVG